MIPRLAISLTSTTGGRFSFPHIRFFCSIFFRFPLGLYEMGTRASHLSPKTPNWCRTSASLPHPAVLWRGPPLLPDSPYFSLTFPRARPHRPRASTPFHPREGFLSLFAVIVSVRKWLARSSPSFVDAAGESPVFSERIVSFPKCIGAFLDGRHATANETQEQAVIL